MKVFTGTVIRTSDKTAKVAVTRVVAHPIYKKRIKRTKNFLVHDEVGVTVGAQVQFVDSKPYSKLKRWKIVPSSAKATAGKQEKVEKTVKKAEVKKSVKKIIEKKGVTPKKNAKKANAK
jgi:small subunit ribosomal protein S17